MLAVFFVTYINYGLIYLAAGADLRECRVDFFNQIFEGLYPDFNAVWFIDFGNLIVGVMISNMYWPPLEFFVFFGLGLIKKMLDQRSLCPRNHNNTRSKTIQAFLEIYSGPVFDFHYKYSYILVVVFVTFTFGAGLPILFPIAFCSLALLFICERL